MRPSERDVIDRIVECEREYFRLILLDCRRLIVGRASRGNEEAIAVLKRIDEALA